MDNSTSGTIGSDRADGQAHQLGAFREERKCIQVKGSGNTTVSIDNPCPTIAKTINRNNRAVTIFIINQSICLEPGAYKWPKTAIFTASDPKSTLEHFRFVLKS